MVDQTCKKSFWNTLGVVITLSGMNCMAIVKVLIGQNMPLLSIISVIVGIILMWNYRDINRTNLVMPASILLIILYSFSTTLLAFFSDVPIMASGRGAIYQLAYLLQILMLWNCRKRIDMNLFISILFWVLGIFCIPCVFVLFQNSRVIDSFIFNYLATATGEEIISREATANLGYQAFVVALVYRSPKKKANVSRVLVMIMAVFIMVCSNRRSIYLAVLINIIWYLRATDRLRFKKRVPVIGGIVLPVMIVCILGYIYFSNEVMRDTVERAFNSLRNAIGTYLGVVNTDQSAMYRSARLATYPQIFFNDSTFLEYLCGRGYFKGWFDLPYFQAIWDMGILGALPYYSIQYLISIKGIIRKSLNPAVLVAQFLTIHSIISSFVNGYPYGCFFSIVLLIVFTLNENKRTPTEYRI